MSQTFASLRYPNYRLWFGGALVANVGTWMQRVAQDWLVLTVLTDHDAFSVGLVTALQFLPMLLLVPVAGVLADRFDPRLLLLITQSALGVLSAAVGILVLTGHAQLWHLYIAALLLGIIAAFDAPPRQVFVAELVPADHLANAVGLNSASFNAARMIGPGLAGLLIAGVGPGWVFIINAATFAATILALMAMRSSLFYEVPRAPREPGQIRAAIAYVRRRDDILVVLLCMAVASAFGLNFQLTSAVMASEVFGYGPEYYGLIGSVMAIGSLAGALAAARRPRPRVRLVVGAVFAFGVADLAMALMPTFWTYVIASIPVGFCALTMITAANTTVQLTTEPQMRGRVMALYLVVFLGATPIGSPLVGWVGEQFGGRWAIGIGAVACMVVAIIAAIWARRSWGVELSYSRRLPFVQLTTSQEREVVRQEQARLTAQDAERPR